MTNQKAIFKFYESIVHKQLSLNCCIERLKDKIQDGTIDGSPIISTRFNLNLEQYIDRMSDICLQMSKLEEEFRKSEVWLKVIDKPIN